LNLSLVAPAAGSLTFVSTRDRKNAIETSKVEILAEPRI
jgi:hypothetical protein